MYSTESAVLPGAERKVVIAVGRLAVTNNQNVTLATYSLGSCLGITLYDPVTRTGGLLHAMLPDSSINAAKGVDLPGMFVDTGVAALFSAASELGADTGRVQICVAGGAHFIDKSGFFNMGQRNYECFSELLRQHHLSINAEEVGGLVSRSLNLDLATGQVRVKTCGQTDETILFMG